MKNLRRYGNAPFNIAVVHNDPDVPGEMTAVGFPRHVAQRGIIRNVFLRTKIISGNAWDGFEITPEETS